eukprot:2772057-Rhodomonas_salina.1
MLRRRGERLSLRQNVSQHEEGDQEVTRRGDTRRWREAEREWKEEKKRVEDEKQTASSSREACGACSEQGKECEWVCKGSEEWGELEARGRRGQEGGAQEEEVGRLRQRLAACEQVKEVSAQAAASASRAGSLRVVEGGVA